MKTYIVYDTFGEEIGYVKAANMNAAEIKAEEIYGVIGHVAYTEI